MNHVIRVVGTSRLLMLLVTVLLLVALPRPTVATVPGVNGRIAFSSDRAGSFAIWTMNSDGTNPVQVTIGGPDTQPDVSPDGRRIVFASDRTSTNAEVFVVNADGSSETQLTNAVGNDFDPTWSPDGTRIAFVSTRSLDRDIWSMDPAGGGLVNVSNTPGNDYDADWGAFPSLDPVTRLFGSDRIATGIAVSQASYPPGTPAGAVVLARSDDFPDALAGTPLAVQVGGPILLTANTALDPRVEAELQRVLGPGGTVYLLGGTAALSDAVAARVQQVGYNVNRLAGPNRFGTAVAIATALGAPVPMYLATGHSFQAAEIAGVAAGFAGGAVLLTADAQMPVETQNYLNSRAGVATTAVGQAAIQAAPTATPVGGGDAYEVARNLANQVWGASPPVAGLASGTVFADGLTGGPLLANQGGPLLLTEPGGLPPSVRTYLVNHAPPIGVGFVLGGSAAIAEPVVQDFQLAITGLP